jgi:RNA polymerase sigma-70 factor (ECF subfamily)
MHAMRRPRARERRVLPLEREAATSDADLVVRARGGDRFAEDALVRRHLPAVAATVARLLGDPIEAEDVVQDTFAAAMNGLDALRDPSAVRAWLMQSAVNKVHRRFRRRRWLRWIGMGQGEPAGLADMASVDATQEQHAELVLLDRALATLAPVERIAWCLRHVEGMQLDEVASACGASLATIKRRIAQADARLRAHVSLEAPVKEPS